jgi:mannosyltransferase
MLLKIHSKRIGLTAHGASERSSQGRGQHLGRLLPILIGYLSLAFYGIDHQSLWLDEVFSVRSAASTEPIWMIPHGPLYFALLRLWLHVGTSELALRSLSVLLGAVAICLIYALSVTMFNRRVAVIGTVLFATSPFLIWYSQETRYITLMLMTTLLTMYTLQQAISRSGFAWWLAYGSAMILALASFVLTLLLSVVHGLYLVRFSSGRRVLRKWAVWQMLVCLLFVWWGSGAYRHAFVRTTDNSPQTFSVDLDQLSTGTPKEFTPMMVPYTFLVFSVGFSQGPSLPELHVSRSLTTLLPHAPSLLILCVLFGGLFLLGLMATWRQPDVGALLTLWVAVPVVGTLGVSICTSMAYNVRYVAMALPAYLLLLAVGISRVRRPVVQMILLAAVLFVNGLSLTNYYFNPRDAREDARAAARYLESVVQPRNAVLVVGTLEPLQYYDRGKLPMVRLGNPYRTDRPIAERLQELLRGYDRLWLVEIRPWQMDPTGKVKAALDGLYALVEHRQFPGVDIRSYRLSP